MATTLIKNGTIVTAGDTTQADILIDGETIKTIGRNLSEKADKVIDASDKYVMPGGIDVHTHLALPFGGTVSADDFRTGHIAAAFGGTTTHIDFAMQDKGGTLKQAVEKWHKKAEGKACIDYAYHVGVTDLRDDVMEELGHLAEYGVGSVKLFMAYKGVFMVDDGTLFRAMQQAAKHGFIILVHAENGDAVDLLTKQLVAEGKAEPKWHAESRPPQLEAEATNRAIALAEVTGSALYVVHLTNAEALAAVERAKLKGLPVYAETCTQYFFCTKDDLAKPDFEGAKYVCSPPMRTEKDQQALWWGVRSDALSVVSTDHCPFNIVGQKELGRHSFAAIPNGVPGIEDRLMMVWDQGVNTGKISANRFVQLMSTNPAKIFGMYPKKGTLAVGSDADIVLWDPKAEHTISASTHHMNVDYNLYEGHKVTGMPTTVLLRGDVIIENNEFTGEVGSGQYVQRSGHGL